MVKHSLLFLSNWQPVTINIVVNITKFSQKNVATFCSKIQASKILIRENSAHKIVAMKVFFLMWTSDQSLKWWTIPLRVVYEWGAFDI